MVVDPLHFAKGCCGDGVRWLAAEQEEQSIIPRDGCDVKQPRDWGGWRGLVKIIFEMGQNLSMAYNARYVVPSSSSRVRSSRGEIVEGASQQ